VGPSRNARERLKAGLEFDMVAFLWVTI
jgi:hypothetical protein